MGSEAPGSRLVQLLYKLERIFHAQRTPESGSANIYGFGSAVGTRGGNMPVRLERQQAAHTTATRRSLQYHAASCLQSCPFSGHPSASGLLSRLAIGGGFGGSGGAACLQLGSRSSRSRLYSAATVAGSRPRGGGPPRPAFQHVSSRSTAAVAPAGSQVTSSPPMWRTQPSQWPQPQQQPPPLRPLQQPKQQAWQVAPDAMPPSAAAEQAALPAAKVKGTVRRLTYCSSKTSYCVIKVQVTVDSVTGPSPGVTRLMCA